MTLATVPLFDALAPHRRILVAGCGGGFDVFCGLPLALSLRAAGKEVVLANLTFADPIVDGATELCDGLVRIDAAVEPDVDYFPEYHLACWLAANGQSSVIHCLERTGVVRLRKAYDVLLRHERIDAVVLVDGGTDSLMSGDEAGLGTPCEDVTSMLALRDRPLPRYLVCVGFGIDAYHGVCHAHFLENVAALARAGAFLGTFSVLPQQPEGRAYLDAVRFATQRDPEHASIVNTSVASAIEGRFGNEHASARTARSELFINPLMPIHWCFELEPVIERLLYRDAIMGTTTFGEVVVLVEAWVKSRKNARPRVPIPG